jgi:ABC-type multidrug transport system ATPase subunit
MDLTQPQPIAPDALGLSENGARGGYVELLALQDVVKRWGDVVVLDRVELILEPSTMIWITGSNGAGKTTLLRIAAGLMSPDSGIVDLEGLHPERDRQPYLRRVGFLSAGEGGLYHRMSVRRQLEFWVRMQLMPRAARREAIARVVEQFGLGDLVDRRVERMSMGQRQRVRLAMTFLHDPRLILLDEPLNSLDEEGSDRLNAALERTVARGGAVIWCSPGSDNPTVSFDQRYHLADGALEAR